MFYLETGPDLFLLRLCQALLPFLVAHGVWVDFRCRHHIPGSPKYLIKKMRLENKKLTKLSPKFLITKR